MTEMDRKQIIAERIKLAREQAGLSQGKLAKILKYHRPTISEIEAGRRNVTADELSELADILKVSVTWLSAAKNDPSDSGQYSSKIQLAARELSKIKKDDLDKVLNLLATLRKKS